jgi:hypothetical protein
MKDPYLIYVETFGKVKSGNKLGKLDYGEMIGVGFKAYDEKGTLAVSMAAQDVKIEAMMKSKKEFETEIKKLLGE